MSTPNSREPINIFGVDNTARVQIIVQTECHRVTVQENYNSVDPPIADLLFAQPAGGTQINVSKGVPFIFTPPNLKQTFKPGDIAGDIETVSGSITVQQTETQQI